MKRTVIVAALVALVLSGGWFAWGAISQEVGVNIVGPTSSSVWTRAGGVILSTSAGFAAPSYSNPRALWAFSPYGKYSETNANFALLPAERSGQYTITANSPTAEINFQTDGYALSSFALHIDRAIGATNTVDIRLECRVENQVSDFVEIGRITDLSAEPVTLFASAPCYGVRINPVDRGAGNSHNAALLIVEAPGVPNTSAYDGMVRNVPAGGSLAWNEATSSWGPMRATDVGNGFYAVKRTNITTSSVNLAFGFTSRKVAVETPITNTDDVCIDWIGGTAVCPAADTAGDDRLAPGTTLVLDDYLVASLSVIAASGTQTVSVRGWN